jgi:hypothetical protein
MTTYITDPIACDAVTRRETGVREHLSEREARRLGDGSPPALQAGWWSVVLRHTWFAATCRRVVRILSVRPASTLPSPPRVDSSRQP